MPIVTPAFRRNTTARNINIIWLWLVTRQQSITVWSSSVVTALNIDTHEYTVKRRQTYRHRFIYIYIYIYTDAVNTFSLSYNIAAATFSKQDSKTGHNRIVFNIFPRAAADLFDIGGGASVLERRVAVCWHIVYLPATTLGERREPQPSTLAPRPLVFVFGGRRGGHVGK